jgi:hypothetical protein
MFNGALKEAAAAFAPLTVPIVIFTSHSSHILYRYNVFSMSVYIIVLFSKFFNYYQPLKITKLIQNKHNLLPCIV